MYTNIDSIHNQKKRLLSLLPPAIFAISVSTAEAIPKEGYNSQDGAVELGRDPSSAPSSKRVYTLYQIEQLGQAIAPRYVRVMTFREKAGKGSQVEKGILFTYEGYRNRSISLAGDFSNWSPIAMRRNRKGVFYHLLPLRRRENGEVIGRYSYKYIVDGLWSHDPLGRSQHYDESGALLSLFYLDQYDVNRQAQAAPLLERRKKGRGALPERQVEFAIYLPSAKNVSLVGDFNNWNPDHDAMMPSAKGIFKRQMPLLPGGYSYMYVADGEWILDKYNKDTRYNSLLGGLCSFVEVE